MNTGAVPTATDIVIIGAGQAGVQVAGSLREAGHTGAITLVANEEGNPYQRPPLSKAFLHTPDAPALPLRTVDALAQRGVAVIFDHATSIDRSRMLVNLPNHDALPYGHLILATGARNRAAPIPGIDHTAVRGLRTLKEAQALRIEIERAKDIVVIGGGFIGTEFASSVAMAGKPVTLIERGARVMERAVSSELSAWVTALHRARGNTIHLSTGLSELEPDGDRVILRTDAGDLPADLVLLAIGVDANCELAIDAGLATNNGVVVDGALRTPDPHISAIGDCAQFPSTHVRRSIRLESVQNATDQARYLAQRLTGAQDNDYSAAPWFWTHQFDSNIQMVGLAGDGDESVVIGDPATSAFSIFRVADDRITAVESVNSPRVHLTARKLFMAGQPVHTAHLDQFRSEAVQLSR